MAGARGRGARRERCVSTSARQNARTSKRRRAAVPCRGSGAGARRFDCGRSSTASRLDGAGGVRLLAPAGALDFGLVPRAQRCYVVAWGLASRP